MHVPSPTHSHCQLVKYDSLISDALPTSRVLLVHVKASVV